MKSSGIKRVEIGAHFVARDPAACCLLKRYRHFGGNAALDPIPHVLLLERPSGYFG